MSQTPLPEPPSESILHPWIDELLEQIEFNDDSGELSALSDEAIDRWQARFEDPNQLVPFALVSLMLVTNDLQQSGLLKLVDQLGALLKMGLRTLKLSEAYIAAEASKLATRVPEDRRQIGMAKPTAGGVSLRKR